MNGALKVEPGFSLADIDFGSTPGFDGDKAAGEQELKDGTAELAQLQEMLFAESRSGGTRRVLLVLQGMDTAGKGGIMRHVVGAVDPQGIDHYAFKAPSDEEKKHDFLWRIKRQLPGPGMIGVFDRSHYEDVLIHRVRQLTPLHEIEQRYDLINAFESKVAASETRIVKVMLHISADQQKKRLKQRLDNPDKHWKYNPGDVDERLLWDDYQQAYQTALERTSTDTAPWYVVPADHKWYARLAVQNLLLDALRQLDLDWPKATFNVEAEKARLAAS
ncbi:polyphosphate kinase 2 family protein [Diaminobutyricimonas sp. TR449]|uniref:polyphosphate kinase 2 family protein n=1 Tax=Diaminobutyricimonas sp. TR449 TaxID=2708076 RepID=UPI00142198EC|nr:polyphosphate kinase 2 family protein [Diaminobutyricimonas sp. TR449]